jgi:hypothetical protein
MRKKETKKEMLKSGELGGWFVVLAKLLGLTYWRVIPGTYLPLNGDHNEAIFIYTKKQRGFNKKAMLHGKKEG